MICPNCKNEVNEEEILCPNCSYNIQADKKESTITQIKKEINKNKDKNKKYTEMERELNPIIRVILKLIYFATFYLFLFVPIIIMTLTTKTKEISADFVSYRETSQGYVALYKFEVNNKEEFFEVQFSNDKDEILDKYPVLIYDEMDEKKEKTICILILIGTISITGFVRCKSIKFFYKKKLERENKYEMSKLQ